ncbi:hypothetical protein K7432_010470 [Basidiobolus ranarum]|uniref:BHLH domain-containing protein n=1 Tax=Basidiobolus ranarum TaxID=34480 RepID=A0ABR2WNP4_9FUNG
MDRESEKLPSFRQGNYSEKPNPSRARSQQNPFPRSNPPSTGGTSLPHSPSVTSRASLTPTMNPHRSGIHNPMEGSSTCSTSNQSSDPPPSNKKPSLTSYMANRRLKGYRFEDSIREFTPEKLFKNKDSKRSESYVVNGVNILNRDEVDSLVAMNRIQKRREQHNRVERRRRDLINTAIEELSEIVPNVQEEGIKYARGNVLRLAIEYIKDLQTEVEDLRLENVSLKRENSTPYLESPVNPPMIVVNQDCTANIPNTHLDTDIHISQDTLMSQMVKLQSSSDTLSSKDELTSLMHPSPSLTILPSSPISSPYHSHAHMPANPQRLTDTGFILPTTVTGPSSSTENITSFNRSPYLVPNTSRANIFEQATPSMMNLLAHDHPLNPSGLNNFSSNQSLMLQSFGYPNMTSPPPPPHSQV